MIPSLKTNAMLICDYVITEEETHKKSLIGIFENISAFQFPCTHHSLSVYIKLTEGQGAYRFRLDLVDLKNDRVVTRSEIPKDVVLPSPLTTHELVFNLRNLQFATPGDYEFRIFGNDQIFGQKTFNVSQMKRPASPEENPLR